MALLKSDFETLKHMPERMSGLAQTVEDCIECGATESAYEHALELQRSSEEYVLLARELPCEFGRPDAHAAVDRIAIDSLNCDIGYTEEGWFRLTIPMLLPKKDRTGSVEYIRTSLWRPMIEFFKSNPTSKLDDCVIIFRYIYKKSTPKKRRRDHDNIETKQVTDIVAWFTMIDDGPTVCRHYYCSASGEENHTEVYVVPTKDFRSWLAKYEK